MSGALGLKRNQSRGLAFRAKVGADASELAKSGPNSYLADIVANHFDFKKLTYSEDMTEEEKIKYREQRTEIEKKKKLVVMWKKDWESGKLQGRENAPEKACRVTGSGPAPKLATIDDLLLKYYVDVTSGGNVACPRPILFVKLVQLISASSGEGIEGAPYLEDGSPNLNWADRYLYRWMEKYGLHVKNAVPNVKLNHSDLVVRIHVFFRNLTMVRAAFEPEWLEADFYDRAPFFRRMGGSSAVAGRGMDAKPVLAKPGGARFRFTVVAPSSSDCAALRPTILSESESPGPLQDFERITIAANKDIRAVQQYAGAQWAIRVEAPGKSIFLSKIRRIRQEFAAAAHFRSVLRPTH